MKIGFYGPKFYPLNNFSAHMVEFEGVLYPTAEHAYQATKCLSHEGKQAIRTAKSPLQTKYLANEKYARDKDPAWDSKKVTVMEAILRAKATQHSEIMALLSDSGQELIAEDSPIDYFWGEGADGSGKNMLGKLWMKLRDELINR